ncbi:MAG: hypothetical protein ACRYFZ_09210 [Janthinobacterium lividum]
MKIGVLSGLLLAVLAARAQSIPASGRTPASFIPSGYRLLPEGRITGDLNGDGRPDVVLALRPIIEDIQNDDNTPPRLLLVLWRTATGSYRLATVARRALLCKECGGVHGDPFEGLRIEREVLSIYHYGGSSWRWSLTAKFRFQQNDIYQIGSTYNYTHTIADACPQLRGEHRPGDEYHDVNLVTGEFQAVRVSEECQMLENQHGRQPVRPLRKLADYQPAP